jgi:RNA polymerase sigma-70 factor (ECF subfamily)
MTSSSCGGREDMDEWRLLTGACGGDERAFGLLFERYRPGLEEFCGLMLGDPRHAEHVMQEVILTAWRERGFALTSSSVRMWLHRIAVRLCLDDLECPR